MININVEGGTARLGENLCKTCRWSVIAEMVNGKTHAQCTQFDNISLTAAVVRCNSYQNKNTADLYSMKEIAWTITADPKGKMGFAPPNPNKKPDPLDDLL